MSKSLLPFVSICTPTFNRRPFIPFIIKCFNHQTYPRDRMEWIIIDDGTDKIEDMVTHIPEVKYFKYDEKLTLGNKRNIMNDKCRGDIIVYMDDDDYYPPERVSHAVHMLTTTPEALCAGSSEMYIFFKHILEMYKFGPYGDKHATAATFAFKRELLQHTRFNSASCLAEERAFLQNYTIPFVQLDPMKTILVFSHTQNSYDKRDLLLKPNKLMQKSNVRPSDFALSPDFLSFFLNDIDNLLTNYKPGDVLNKPDVLLQIDELNRVRETANANYQVEMLKTKVKTLQSKTNEMTVLINGLTLENADLKDKVSYFEGRIKQIVSDRIAELKHTPNMLI